MPVLKSRDIKFSAVQMDGVKEVSKCTTIGPKQGWKENAMRVFRIGPSGFTPHHEHEWEHVNYIIKGKGFLTLGEKKEELSPGDYVFVPPGMMHQFQNPFEEDFEFICIVPAAYD